jgi:fructose-1,6-bisphosphatase-3
MRNFDYLKLLSKQHPTIADVTTEIINLKAILNLPKATEHFLTDIHGEYEAFSYHLKSASGVLKFKIDDIFGHTLTNDEKRSLTTLIIYPEKRLKHIKKNYDKSMTEWYKVTIYRLVTICKVTSSKYTRSKVKKALPEDFNYILDELLNIDSKQLNKEKYYDEIIDSIVELERSDEFIAAICHAIQKLAVDKLHIIGDVYDRGPAPHLIMDELLKYPTADVQWGNHDILWMGAALGHHTMVAEVLRIAMRYNNIRCLEEGYGINLLPLGSLAMTIYKDDPCKEFMPKRTKGQFYEETDELLIARMHKAIAIIQFKLEGQLIKRKAVFKRTDRLLLDMVDYEKGTLTINDKEYQLSSCNFPTIDPKNPYVLTKIENEVINKLAFYFKNSEKLQKHIYYFYTNGSLYLKYNGNLLYHGCILLNEEGDYLTAVIEKKEYKGVELLDKYDDLVRRAYFTKKESDIDWLWYLWTGRKSPMFAKEKMATFERYFTNDKELQHEKLNPYFHYREDEAICKKILTSFGLDPDKGHIISGHTPVKVINGENPLKANGRLLVIDGGMSRAYQNTTGIAGYTLMYNSWGLRLVSHHPFTSEDEIVAEGVKINSNIDVLHKTNRKTVGDTDIGKRLIIQINDLKELMTAYKSGQIQEMRK